ncbi:hypothetical protein W97_00559 [Coniosporium apollinis CBS 100218]|uniref:Cell wall mannoprotein PIR1-like C-terminal domain-containing protein n=1 Tax=Coniosporium apollinis (strain CBS 100218) TaxID=1168221 RepID=R7YHG1_CONA1|nr:uncharacterized protein W97_00559 [Coniosporium apollinis CBS 100218]EON61345.1 hypothetical protein W97_00559 [Coniosporium apollinis CBS 100218]
MQYSLAVLALAAAAAASPFPQGVTEEIAPEASAPAGCQVSYPGEFQVTVVNATTANKVKRQESGGPADTVLTLSLEDGILTDQQGRTGYIASNFQWQYDAPPQAGAIYTAGFSVCENGSLALGGSAVFYGCDSGDFYNLYDRNWADTCSPIYIVAVDSGSGSATQSADGQPAASTGASVRPDGQPVATSGAPVRSDGQPIATSAASVAPVRSDGQPIASSAADVAPVRSDGQPIASSAADVAPVRSDGQPIVSSAGSAVPVRSDGQPIATSAASVVPVRSDGQPIATSAASVVPVRSDGQPIASSAASVVPVRSDGQPIASSAASVVPVRSDGQPIATSVGNASATATPQPFLGGASGMGVSSLFGLIAAAGVAVAML